MPKPKPKPIGQKIQSLRSDRDMSLKDLANQTGHSEEYLAKIEANEIFPPVALLIQVSRALEVDSGTFLKEDDVKDSATRRAAEQAKRTAHYSYKTLTPAATNKHLKGFHITIPAGTIHEGVGYQHEGEEFVYVLTGEVDVMVGENINRLTDGEALHFNSSITHQMTNVGSDEAKLIVVLFTP